VARIFDLLHSTVESLAGQMQIIVMDHAELTAPWFHDAVGRTPGAAAARSCPPTGTPTTCPTFAPPRAAR
jgi:hypothetical protein